MQELTMKEITRIYGGCQYIGYASSLQDCINGCKEMGFINMCRCD